MLIYAMNRLLKTVFSQNDTKKQCNYNRGRVERTGSGFFSSKERY
nr:hypothetical protein [Agriterribacter sp.]